ncbi:hypothetical protein SK128_005199 [Halocaridina rubra]|uniref:STK11-interacting protein C-terminal PH domain-containing protein n=1 Tax=Halocaridina rubra TaxID=373956 RepID=A0AAN8WS03_HALRR
MINNMHYDITGDAYKTAQSTLLSAVDSGTPPCSTDSPSQHFSSSSTSIDTIRHDVLTPSLHHKAVMTSIVDDTDPENIVGHTLTSWVQSLLHTLTGYAWLWWEEIDEVEGIHRLVNPIRYSYEDFSDIDHRLKLHCEVLLFHEPDELLLGLVKGILLLKEGLREFQGLLVISSKKFYVLEIVGQEDDSPQTWLELQSSYSLSEVTVVHSLYQRQGLGFSIGESDLLLSLADSHRANCFFNFFLETVEEYGVRPSIQECSPAQEDSLISIVKETLPPTSEEASISLFAIVSLLLEGGCSESQFLTVTTSDLALYHANLDWYMPPVPLSKLQLNLAQKIANIIAIEVHSDRHLSLQFLDEATGEESSWELHVTTPVAACHIIQAIRTPWMHLFSVDLEVKYHSSSQEQCLKAPESESKGGRENELLKAEVDQLHVPFDFTQFEERMKIVE